jgi:hypothetical protein
MVGPVRDSGVTRVTLLQATASRDSSEVPNRILPPQDVCLRDDNGDGLRGSSTNTGLHTSKANLQGLGGGVEHWSLQCSCVSLPRIALLCHRTACFLSDLPGYTLLCFSEQTRSPPRIPPLLELMNQP